ncbi:ferric reductase like transmembrane component [Pseudomassariella vexata]|uniref:Ferric reductase like transmembrane component n=1 Tax=Pseudomassariella vexata TaxID=1141098 RepID=A0A1Y2DKJ7_9PEZI|nr:ferric reductase like transmembrane component [Pseudomassariella vexata]ORY59763.1 ferric reductase like transmembrane component [Pseudomassariella vexata]
MRPQIALSALTAISAAATGHDLRGAPCFEACQMVIRPLEFTDANGIGGSPKLRMCRSRISVTSLYLCTKVYCTPEERTSGLDAHNETCRTSVQVPLPPFEEVLANYTEDEIALVQRFGQDEWEDKKRFEEAVVAEDGFFELAYNTIASWSYVYRHHYIYGSAVVVFWVLVMAIGLLSRLVVSLGCTGMAKRRGWQAIPLGEPGDDARQVDKEARSPSHLYLWWKRHVSIPAAFGYRNAQPFGWYTVPPRIQSLSILVFIAINIFFCVHGYHIFPGNLYYPDVWPQAWRYISDRTGIVSFANFPIIWLFGMRNNLMMELTGWDFGTYNNFHRWVARVSTVQAVVHSIGYTILVFDSGGWTQFAQYWTELWWITGEMATITMCTLLPLSLYWMRRNAYEAFLALHIALSVLVLFSMLGHISSFGFPWDRLFWVSCSIWALDRIMRVTRTLAFNRAFWNTRAKATYDPDSNMVRLYIPCSQSLYRPRPGTYYYLHLLSDARFWESHPFTMASISNDDGRARATSLRPNSGLAEEAAALLSQDTLLEEEYPRNENLTMLFLIRPYDSFTGRLRDAAAASWPRPASLRMLVEGPYGRSQPLHQFETVLFVVGGSGIVVPLAHLSSLTKSTAKTIRIVWAVREPAFAGVVAKEDFGNVLFDEKLGLDVYITRPTTRERRVELPKEVRVMRDRPDVHAEIEDAVRDFGARGSIAVVACGPARMADDARRAVVEILGSGADVEYFEESFRW